MDEPLTIIAVIFISAAILIGGFAAFVLTLRWIFRTDELLEALRNIELYLRPPEQPAPRKAISPFPNPSVVLGVCDACKRELPVDSLAHIGIGKTVCPACKKFIESKKS